MTDKQILKSIKALARGECANYDRGNCLLTDERCHLVNPNYESMADANRDQLLQKCISVRMVQARRPFRYAGQAFRATGSS